MSFDIHIDVILCALTVLGIRSLMNWYRSPRVWIIEDNECDMDLLRYRIKTQDVAFTYLNSVDDFAKQITTPWNFKKPDLVICDYHLDKGVKGTKIIDLCERNGVKDCLLITGDDKEILGIDSSKVIRKSADKEFYETLSNWIMTRELKHG